MNGEVGKDMGDDNWSGEVGRDIFESEWLINELLIVSGMSDEDSVHRTVGNDIG